MMSMLTAGLFGGCTTLPSLVNRTASMAIFDTGETGSFIGSNNGNEKSCATILPGTHWAACPPAVMTVLPLEWLL